MGPTVKFVSGINGTFSKKNYGLIFVHKKRPPPKGVWQKTTLFQVFFGPLPLCGIKIGIIFMGFTIANNI